jgi:hypothetical protein
VSDYVVPLLPRVVTDWKGYWRDTGKAITEGYWLSDALIRISQVGPAFTDWARRGQDLVGYSNVLDPRTPQQQLQDWYARPGQRWAATGSRHLNHHLNAVAKAAGAASVGVSGLAPLAQRMAAQEAARLAAAGLRPKPPQAAGAPANPNRGLTWTTERTGRSSAARDWEDSAVGATSDVATQRRNVPALRYDNPNPRGKNLVRFDAVDPINPKVVVIDRKWAVTTKTDQVNKFKSGPLEALRQNPDYRLRIEVPNRKAATDARRLLRYATGSDTHPQIDIVVTPPLNSTP